MARRNDHTRDELIALTLNTVKDFLSSHSYHELSLRKIAGMIGYVPSTLVNVFGNYDLLLLNVVAQTVDELQEASLAAIKHTQDPRQALYELALCYHAFAKKNPYRWQLIFQHNLHGESLPDWQSERIKSMTGMLENLIEQLAPERSEKERLEASRVLWAGVHGITLLSVDNMFYTSAPINGKKLIINLLENYLQGWQ
ncbi:TetR family transcriptional regulator [Vibrio sp. HA2012]|uniref:TetR/AcrR family transcriptional regulator n=1 Tax=Vibrio sp. HA2012 TaxID=1971595 RepID=UPI000C2BE53C|nr:TetR-like C-terminal domain-containing protein [Vibrio sp. HA2012]PJC85518.1 TetR family transcriptional regulator [Vibrio sp. HA2012]